ncbi:RHS repeat-associated protein [Luteibacter sp. Sphag1AF]|uniref:RHS repeat-associated core domain-containing protein n=1 Tax=Luteibacter sp. Sphag1AF TaxID=2587031 RepID=UPI0017E463ED|nr:RHS repeat-associated core domain-containing protein [Luteibacter sp. Sphag1AF]MBB3227927.1 RHS repeat-associated protein [Luteibacter sp. Sphag1AF]
MRKQMKSSWHIAGSLLLASSLSQAANASEKVTFYYTDVQGTVLATADEQGNLSGSSDRKPYGIQVMGMRQNGPGYTGHIDDSDTALIYMQARYYDPEVGRFLSTDPIRPSAANVYGFNGYAYANNNPVRFIDPDGRFSRGANWDAKSWKEFNRAQQNSAKRLENVAAKINGALKSGAGLKEVTSAFERNFGEGSATTENLTKVASDLSSMAAALRDTSPDAIAANATTTKELQASYKDVKPTTLAGVPKSGPKQVLVNMDHPAIGNEVAMAWAAGHEAAHAVLDYDDHSVNGVNAYKLGTTEQQNSFRDLPSSERLVNPDHLMNFSP